MTSDQDTFAVSGYGVFLFLYLPNNSKSKIMKHWLPTILISAVCLAGCAEKEIKDIPDNTSNTTVFTAEILTKTVLVESNNKVNWSDGTKVVLQISYTEPGLKGDTATNTLKPATLETGAEIRVPLFITEGEFVEVDTRDGSYVGRVKM